MNSLRRLLAVLRKEIWQLKRDRLTVGMIFGIPIMQVLLFGYAINTDIRHISTAVVDEAHTQLTQNFIKSLEATQVVSLQQQVSRATEIEDLMRAGKISIGIVIPKDFERRIQDRNRAAAQLMVDGSDPVILGAAQGLNGMNLFQRSQQTKPQAKLFEIRHYYNPEKRSAVNTIPGLIGVILTMTMVIFTAISLVRERERGNLELLINTPISTNELMIGKILPYILIGVIQVTVVLFLGVWIFDVPIQGQLSDVYVIALLFVASNLTLGIFFSTLAKSQLQALQMAIFIMLPSILLSGFMFPFTAMPTLAQWLAELLPLTHFIRLIRGVMLRGADLSEMVPELIILAMFTLVTLFLAVKRFHKRLD